MVTFTSPSVARSLSRIFSPRVNRRRILYVQYTNPGCYPPLCHSSRILAGAGWDVIFLGTESYGSSNMMSLPSDPRIRFEKMSAPPIGGLLKLHYFWFCVRVLWKTLLLRPAWLYASDILSCPPALAASLLTGARIILHEHDSPSRQGTILNLLFWVRTWLARRACLNVLPNTPRAHAFREETQAKAVKVVWNCPLIQEIPTPKPSASGLFVLYYHGNISPELCPLALITSLQLLPEAIVLRIVGYETMGQTGYIKKFKQTAASIGVAHRIFVAPPTSRHNLLLICQEGDVGLALFPEPTGPANSYAGASNKVFDYLCCGLPVLVSNHREWNFLHGAGLALRCTPADPESIAAAVLQFYNHREETRSMGRRGREKVLRHWNYEVQFEPILRLLEGDREAS